MLGNAFDDGDPMLTANVKTDVIDADAHVVENERVWDYLEAGEQKYRPTLAAEPDNPERQHWLLDGEDLGPKFPSPNEKQSQEHVKRFGREVGTPVQARELSDVTQRLRHMDALGIDVQCSTTRSGSGRSRAARKWRSRSVGAGTGGWHISGNSARTACAGPVSFQR